MSCLGHPHLGAVACTAPPGRRDEVEAQIRTEMARRLGARYDEIEVVEVPQPPWEVRLVGIWWPPS